MQELNKEEFQYYWTVKSPQSTDSVTPQSTDSVTEETNIGGYNLSPIDVISMKSTTKFIETSTSKNPPVSSTFAENQYPPTTEEYGLIDDLEAYAMTIQCPLSIQQKCNKLENFLDQVKWIIK